jgi:aspartate carbamoyltransferase catalytic subunit
LFFEPSTRTRMSFETAMKRLGGEVVNLGAVASSSVVKGETLHDTIRMVDGYSDVIALRHPLQGAAQYASDCANVPIANAGDGAGHHPTQTMLDLFTIKQAHGRIENLNVVLVGDLRFGRTVHSLSYALVRLGCKLTLVSPESLRLPDEIISELTDQGGKLVVTDELKPQLEDADVVYMTRIQKERFPDEDEYVRVAGIYKLDADDLSSVKTDMIVMHPLPRVDEINPDVDSTKHAAYFEQAFNGVVTRMALLCDMLNISIPDKIGGEN